MWLLCLAINLLNYTGHWLTGHFSTPAFYSKTISRDWFYVHNIQIGGQINAIRISWSHYNTQRHITGTHDYKGKSFTGFQWHNCANGNRTKYNGNICKGRHGHFPTVWHINFSLLTEWQTQRQSLLCWLSKPCPGISNELLLLHLKPTFPL